MRWWASFLATVIAGFVIAGSAYAEARAVRLRMAGCVPAGWEEAAFRSAVSVELAILDVTVREEGSTGIEVEVRCSEDARAASARIAIEGTDTASEVALDGVEPAVDLRALAIAVHDAMAAALNEAREREATGDAETRDRETTEPEAPVDARPATTSEAANEVSDSAAALTPTPTPTPAPVSGPRLALEIGAPVFVLVGPPAVGGGALVALELGASRFPIAAFVRARMGYVEATDVLGRAMGIHVDGGLGVRAWLDLSPLRLGVEAGVAAGLVRLEGTTMVEGVIGNAYEALGVTLEVHGRGEVRLTEGVGIAFALGVRGHLLGLDGRSGERAALGFVGASPSGSIELVLAL